MAYADGFSPTTLGILFSHTASRYIFLFSYLASTQEEIIPRKQYIIFIEYSRGDTTLTLTTQLLYHGTLTVYYSWESLVISTDLE